MASWVGRSRNAENEACDDERDQYCVRSRTLRGGRYLPRREPNRTCLRPKRAGYLDTLESGGSQTRTLTEGEMEAQGPRDESDDCYMLTSKHRECTLTGEVRRAVDIREPGIKKGIARGERAERTGCCHSYGGLLFAFPC